MKLCIHVVAHSIRNGILLTKNIIIACDVISGVPSTTRTGTQLLSLKIINTRDYLNQQTLEKIES